MIPVESINRLLEIGATRPVINVPSDDGIPFVVIPSETKVESLLPLMPLHHVKRKVVLDDVKSFCDYVNQFKDDGTLVFCQAHDAGATFKAIVDYHMDHGEVRFCDHEAVYATRPTPEWTLWMTNDRKPKGQEEFATFLEENGYLFKQPAGAELIELVTSLFAKKDVSYTGGIRLKSGGVTLNYDEQVEVTGSTAAKPGRMELPPMVTAGISPFIGAPTYQVDARLKYSIPNRTLMLRYETITPHVIIRDSIKLLVDKVAEMTKITPLMGQT
jgi:uncharacterized protein YfdQ (DUF2303 family)